MNCRSLKATGETAAVLATFGGRLSSTSEAARGYSYPWRNSLGASLASFSFDYDPQSVACTREMKKTYAAGSRNWHIIERGSVRRESYIRLWGRNDVVYSWVFSTTPAYVESAYRLVTIPPRKNSWWRI